MKAKTAICSIINGCSGTRQCLARLFAFGVLVAVGVPVAAGGFSPPLKCPFNDYRLLILYLRVYVSVLA